MSWRKGRNNRHYSVPGLPHAPHKTGMELRQGHSVVLGLRATRNLEIAFSMRQGWVITGLTHRVTALGES